MTYILIALKLILAILESLSDAIEGLFTLKQHVDLIDLIGRELLLEHAVALKLLDRRFDDLIVLI